MAGVRVQVSLFRLVSFATCNDPFCPAKLATTSVQATNAVSVGTSVAPILLPELARGRTLATDLPSALHDFCGKPIPARLKCRRAGRGTSSRPLTGEEGDGLHKLRPFVRLTISLGTLALQNRAVSLLLCAPPGQGSAGFFNASAIPASASGAMISYPARFGCTPSGLSSAFRPPSLLTIRE